MNLKQFTTVLLALGFSFSVGAFAAEPGRSNKPQCRVHFDNTEGQFLACDFSYRDFKKLIFTRAWLGRSNLTGANLSGAILEQADISGSDFSRATLIRANLKRIYSLGTKFTGANLQSANFSGALVYRADFSNADLRGADFTNADTAASEFRGAIYNSSTKLPFHRSVARSLGMIQGY